MRFTRFSVSLLVVLLVATVAWAQTNSTTGQLTGKVTDSSGAALPGVTVTAANVDTGLVRTTVTEANGSYTLSLLPPGNYRVTAELAGLGTATRDRAKVLLGLATTVNLPITPQLAEEIVVTADAPVVDAKQADLATSVTQEQIGNLPILGRDFKDLVLLTPGVTEAFGDRISLNGGRGITSDYNIDGAEANSDFFGEERGGTEAPFVFSQAAIREFQVIRTSYAAEYGKGVGGTMNAITKSGTNEIEGELFWYRRDASWAEERETTIDGETIGDFFEARDSDQYGFALGGPIVRDRLHFFINADFQDITEPVVVFDVRNDRDFEALPAATRSAFVQRVESLLGTKFDDEFSYSSDDDQETYLLKLDSNIGTKHHISLRHNYSDYNNFPSESPRPLSNQGNEFNTVNSTVLEANSIFTNDLYNQLIVQFGLEERPIGALTERIPETRISGGGIFFTFGQSEFLPNRTDEEKWQIKESLTYVWNSHQIKAGFDYVRGDIYNLFPRERAGQYFFNSVDDFLANNPSRLDQGYGPTGGVTEWDYWNVGLYVQDTWSLDQLTLDLGLRYDYQDIPEPHRNQFPNFPEFVNDFNNDSDNIAPRFGFAYDLKGDGRSVVRGGVGRYFTFIPQILYAGPLAEISGNYNRISLRCNRDACPTYPNILTPEQFAPFVRTASDLTTVSPDLEAIESIRTSLGYEQQLGQSYSVSVEAVYADLTNVQRLVNINAVPTGVMLGDLPVYDISGPNSAYPDFFRVKQHRSDAEGSYKSLTLSTRKFALGDSNFSWLAHYTWAEAIDQDSNERSTSTSFSLDPFDASLSEGPADYDVKHRFVASATYELPFGIFVSGIYNWRSGFPYTAGIETSGFFGLNGLDFTGVDTPVFRDSQGNVIDMTQANGLSTTQLAAFLAQRGARMEGRNERRQPDFSNLDVRIAKRFRFFDDFQVELIGEIFNVLNEDNLRISSSNQTMFFARESRGAWTFTRNSDFAKKNSFTGVPRQYQAAIKLHF